MAFGTEEQKRQHLSAIAAGEVIWCQGFSEPDAGSDLAALSTRATEDGDGWRINGQKIWTSYAGMAQWCVLAARVGAGRAPRGHHDVPRSDGHAGHHRAADPVDARPPPPQRGVLRRRAGRPRRRARRRRRRLGRHPQGAGPRARRHRPLRPLRAVAVSARPRAGAALGRPAPGAARPVGPSPGAGAGGPAPRLPDRARPGDGRAPRRHGLHGPHRGHPVRPAGGRAAVPGHRGVGPRGRPQRSRCTARSRTTGATRRRPPSRRAPSRCSA